MRHRPEPYGYLPDGEGIAGPTGPTGQTGTKTPDVRAKAAHSSAMGLATRSVLKTPAFWFLATGAFFQQVGTSAVTVHIVPYLESVGVGTTIAALAVTGMTLCSLLGRLGFGLLGDFANKRYLIAGSLALQMAGILVFSTIEPDRLWLLVLFLLTFGPGYGGPIPLRP